MSNFDDQPYDPFNTQTGSNRSAATRPGLVRLSPERLQRMHPELYAAAPSAEDEVSKVHAAEHLRYGLAEPALVIETQPLIVAAFTNEIDAVGHLGFFATGRGHIPGLAQELVGRHRLRVGSRLLTVNTFQRIEEEGYACDLIPGPKARGVYGNFSPYIAEFLTSDLAGVEERKKLIEEREWQRCQALADEYHKHMIDHRVQPRDGRPMRSLFGVAQAWLPGHAPPHTRRQR